jgi:hypothetical protein
LKVILPDGISIPGALKALRMTEFVNDLLLRRTAQRVFHVVHSIWATGSQQDNDAERERQKRQSSGPVHALKSAAAVLATQAAAVGSSDQLIGLLVTRAAPNIGLTTGTPTGSGRTSAKPAVTGVAIVK